MMNETNFAYSDLLTNLEYGKLYLFASNEQQTEAFESLIHSAKFGHIELGWLSEMELVTIPLSNVGKLGTVIAARKINAGNIGRYSVLACLIQDPNTLFDGLVTFYNNLKSVDSDSSDGTVTLIVPEIGAAMSASLARAEEINYMVQHEFDEDISFKRIPESHDISSKSIHGFSLPSIASPQEPASKGLLDRLATLLSRGKGQHAIADDDTSPAIENKEDEIAEFAYTREDMVRDANVEIVRQDQQEEHYAAALTRQRDRDLQLIQALIIDFIQKYQADPTELIATTLQGKYVVNTTPMLVVNRDRKIIFPEYNEMELKMSAASRTLYIWFLLHPEGTRLKDLVKHRSEIVGIYEDVHPGCNFVEDCVDAMLQPDKLNQNFSRIKKIVRSIILNDDIAVNYFISKGDEGIYSLPIAAMPQKIRLPQSQC